MHGITANLLQQNPLALEGSSAEENGPKTEAILSYDSVAMGYIMVTLKLLLGLDDSTERYKTICTMTSKVIANTGRCTSQVFHSV